MKVNTVRANSIEGFMDESEIQWLAEQAQTHKCIIEIGSYLGRSTVALAENTEGRVFCFDNWKGLQEDHLQKDTREGLFDIFKTNVNGLLESGKVIPLITDHSDEYKITRQLMSFDVIPDMVFIDGRHKYENVKHDIQFWLKKLNGKGLICGHDIMWEGVNRAVSELLPQFKQVGDTSLWYVDMDKTDTINTGVDNTYNTTIGLVIAIPFVGRPVSPEWALSLAAQNYPLNLSRSFCAIGGVSTDIARNKAVEYALEKKANYIWFLDDDVQTPYFAVRQLIYTIEQSDAMVAGGIYFSKSNPSEPLVYRGRGQGAFWKWKTNDIFEVDGLGGGCLLIKTELFKHLEKPYFKTVDDFITEGNNTQNAGTEDIYFCNKVRDAGFKIVADAHVMCTHWDIKTMTPYAIPKDSYPMQKE
jgi:predicted O-methyltransferase YrrM